ncbi:ribosomal L7Ae/L30e/S12e/Gadd45 family protein [Trifolium pratense]|uniref:Ribosomal L7Ae/L30e/S12e/Gadd45 family protein n=1 Tax=Trifolium pratense TaxID=57577 RepID=A0A2K3L785_TRIPR|nr:ribosomal L7Ae/L30e/S12e/Gadd45 family protein [Trifolium pratense]
MMHSRRSNNAKTPNNNGGNNNNNNSNSASLETPNCYEGESLNNLLQSIRRGVESTRHLDGSSLPEKIWIKQQFAIGVNDVTRVLERMKPCAEFERSAQLLPSITSNHKTSSVKLQAVLVASDCNPRWLTKHLQSLASSRSVPLIFVKDNKEGSLRLGELVKLKTAIAIGIKVKGNTINKVVEDVIQADAYRLRPDGPNSAGIFDNFHDPDKKGNAVINII